MYILIYILIYDLGVFGQFEVKTSENKVDKNYTFLLLIFNNKNA